MSFLKQDWVKAFVKWGDRWPIPYHALLFWPVGVLGASYEALTGGEWWWQIATGVLLSIAVLFGQEYADDRAHTAIEEHHKKLELLGIDKSPEVWHGWDWRDFVGGTIGGMIGAFLMTVFVL